MSPTLIVIGVVILLAVYFIATYNGFVVLKTRIQEALSGIDVQLKRRADLIPNLVESVKGYAKHEKEVFENVTAARSALLSAQSPADKAEANNQLTGALKTLFAVAENYPELKASNNFIQLQQELTDTEDKVAYSRQFYNSNVTDFNTKVATFPSSIIANMFGFKPFEFFTAADADRKRVDVKF
jgi:LemA protein